MAKVLIPEGSPLKTADDVKGVCGPCRPGLHQNCQLPELVAGRLRVRTTNVVKALQNTYPGAGCGLVVTHGAAVEE